jgi:hypothetical protein
MLWASQTTLHAGNVDWRSFSSMCLEPLDIRLEGFYSYSELRVIHHRLEPGEYEHSSSKNRGSSGGPQQTKWLLS